MIRTQPVESTCVVCGKSMMVHTRKKIYCSENCNKKAWKARNRIWTLADSKLYQDRIKFGGNYIAAMAETRGRCAHCGVEADTVHHLDNRGDKLKFDLPKNHALENLVAVCDACHRQQHVINWAFDGNTLIIKCEAFRTFLGTDVVVVEGEKKAKCA